MAMGRILIVLLLSALSLTFGCSDSSSNVPPAAISGSGSTGAGQNGTNRPPAVTATTPDTARAGDVVVGVTLIDAESDPVHLQLAYSIDGGATFQPAATTGSTTNLPSSPTGTTASVTWDSRTDLPGQNLMAVRLRLTPADSATGTPVQTADFPLMNLGRRDPDAAYAADRDTLVIEVKTVGGYVPWSYHVNRLADTKIYGDGTVVYTRNGKHDTIYTGRLTEAEIVHLLLQARDLGFWTWSASTTYTGGVMIADAPTYKIRIDRQGQVHEVSVKANGPNGWDDLRSRLRTPDLEPANEVAYTRTPISQTDLNRGSYEGEEHEKKLDTPTSWTWERRQGSPSVWKQP